MTIQKLSLSLVNIQTKTFIFICNMPCLKHEVRMIITTIKITSHIKT